MPIITPKGSLENPSIEFKGQSSWGDNGTVLFFEINKKHGDCLVIPYLVAIEEGRIGFMLYVGRVGIGERGTLLAIDKSIEGHEEIYDEVEDIEYIESEKGNLYIKDPNKFKDVIVQCIAHGILIL